MPLDDAYLQDAEARLAQLSPPLLDAFRDARAVLPAALTDDQPRLWVEEGLALAAHSIRSWEAGADYFRVAPALLAKMDEASFRRWVGAGRALAALPAAIARAHFQASPARPPP